MYYLYCPNCKHESELVDLPRGTTPNCRDGFGRPIFHYECPVCRNLDAGFMKIEGKHWTKEYDQSVISFYQDIRGTGDCMSYEEVLDKVLFCCPPLGWDDVYPDLFGIYGYTFSGVCDGWKWNTEENISDRVREDGKLPITKASYVELLNMLALMNEYWHNQYMEWYRRANND